MSRPGPPAPAADHQAVLAAALADLPRFTAPGQVRDLPVQWAPDGSPAWEALFHAELASVPGG